MKITSNISAVRGRLDRYANAVPLAMQRANAAPEWQAEAREMAGKVLDRLAAEHQKQFIPGFLELVVHGILEGGFSLRMTTPQFDELLQDAEAARARAKAALDAGQSPSYNDLLQSVTWWVENVKRKDARDRHSDGSPKSDDDIAQFITFLLTTSDSNLIGKRAHASQKLEGAIAQWLEESSVTLGRETITLWLHAVLKAWGQLVRAKWPQKFKRELRKEMQAA